MCFNEFEFHPAELVCYLNDTRPGVNLTFSSSTISGDSQLASADIFELDNGLYSSIVKLHLPKTETHAFGLFVCKAIDSPLALSRINSYMIVQLSDINLSGAITIEKQVQRSTDLELQCSTFSEIYHVWIRIIANEVTRNIIESDDYVHVSTDDFHLREGNHSLKIPQTTIADEGLYVCVSGDGITERVRIFNVTVYGR